MDLKKIFQFEPINATKILLYAIFITVIVGFFRPEVSAFMSSLSERGFTVGADGSFTFDALTEPSNILTNVSNESGLTSQNRQSESAISNIDLGDVDFRDTERITKSSTESLISKIKNLKEGITAVIDFVVDNPAAYYYADDNMKVYLALASEKIRYLAFYDGSQFKGYIKIERVIKGMAAKEREFTNFGEKLRNGQWKNFDGLIGAEEAFDSVPTVAELYDRLESSGQKEIPLLKNGKLLAILTHQDVAEGMYKQVKKNSPASSATRST
ncbi:MAG: hypothetical protein ACJAVN_000802 [Roseivirga sp.]|jgi:hypothetical protein